MAFVPEGQVDSSQARSAWVVMQRGPRPGGTVEVMVSPEWREERQVFLLKNSGPMMFDSIVPLGRGYFPHDSRHFVPGYYQPVPPGQKPLAHRGLALS